LPLKPAMKYASSILFTASEVDNCRMSLTTTLIQPFLRHVLSLFAATPTTAALKSTLGLLVNMTNEEIFREIVATEDKIHYSVLSYERIYLSLYVA
jgi:hypothetical protein